MRFYREQAEKCRGLARLTEQLRRQLTDMAVEFDDRARERERSIEDPRTESRSPPPLQPREATEPLTLSIKDAAKLLGLGRSTIYRLIGDRQLETVKVGRRTLIKTASIRSVVDVQG